MIGEKTEDGLVEVAKQAMELPAKELGTQLASLLNLIFTPLQMAQIHRDAWIEDYKRRIHSKYQKIPSEQIQEPPVNIIGPAIEASKYHISTEEMREMFANLVAHACDKRLESDIHPVFVTILTQITPLEASILSSFRPMQEIKIGTSFSIAENGVEKVPSSPVQFQETGLFSHPERILPIVNYYLEKENQRFLVQGNVIETENETDAETVSAAVTNLIRLGLVETNFMMRITNDGGYDWFSQNELYQTLLKDVQPGNGFSMRAIRGHWVGSGQYKSIRIEKGIVHLTQLGYNFIKVCVLEKEVFSKKDTSDEDPISQ